jgi:hypothetical protein
MNRYQGAMVPEVGKHEPPPVGSRLALHAVVIPPATFEVLASLHRSGALAANAAARGPPGAAVAP